MIIEDETPEFLEKLKTAKISLATNLTTEELLGEMEKKLDCKVWIDATGEWHLSQTRNHNGRVFLTSGFTRNLGSGSFPARTSSKFLAATCAILERVWYVALPM